MRHICLYTWGPDFHCVRTGPPEVVQEALADLKWLLDMVMGGNSDAALLRVLWEHFLLLFHLKGILTNGRGKVVAIYVFFYWVAFFCKKYLVVKSFDILQVW